MPARTINLLLHPLRYPEWGELLCAILGGFQFIFALSIYGAWDDRPAFALTVYLSPETWTAAGCILAAGHITSLRFGRTKWGYQGRLMATASSLCFWSHFIVSIFVNALMTDANIPGTLVPSLAAPLLAGAVLYRLWRHY